MIDFKCAVGLYEVRIFSVSENGENGLGDEGTDGAMPSPKIFGLELPLARAALKLTFHYRYGCLILIKKNIDTMSCQSVANLPY